MWQFNDDYPFRAFVMARHICIVLSQHLFCKARRCSTPPHRSCSISLAAEHTHALFHGARQWNRYTISCQLVLYLGKGHAMPKCHFPFMLRRVRVTLSYQDFLNPPSLFHARRQQSLHFYSSIIGGLYYAYFCANKLLSDKRFRRAIKCLTLHQKILEVWSENMVRETIRSSAAELLWVLTTLTTDGFMVSYIKGQWCKRRTLSRSHRLYNPTRPQWTIRCPVQRLDHGGWTNKVSLSRSTTL